MKKIDNDLIIVPKPAAPQQGKPSKRPPYTVMSVGDINAMPEIKEKQILANGYLTVGHELVVQGPSGCGKSRLIHWLAFCHQAEVPWLGWETFHPELKWLFIQVENRPRRIQHESNAMLAAFSPEQQQRIKEGVFFLTLTTRDDRDICIVGNPENCVRISEMIERCGANIIVIDPVRALTLGDLNSDREMYTTYHETVQTVMDGTERTLILIHHSAEGLEGAMKATGRNRGTYGRGSKVLKGATRSTINVVPHDDDDNMRLVISSGKVNDEEEFAPIRVLLDLDTRGYEIDGEFDATAWREGLAGEKTGAHGECSEDAVLRVLRAAGGGLEKKEALQRLRDAGASRRNAEKAVADAIAAGVAEETYHRRKGARDQVFLTEAGSGSDCGNSEIAAA
jgi:hypothetical protein